MSVVEGWKTESLGRVAQLTMGQSPDSKYYSSDDKAGSGIPEMVKQCRKHGLPEPEFKTIRGFEFRSIIARDIFTESALEKLGLNERQLKAVTHLKQKERITNSIYQKLTSVIRKTAARDLDDLVEKGVLERLGEKRGIYYVLVGKK